MLLDNILFRASLIAHRTIMLDLRTNIKQILTKYYKTQRIASGCQHTHQVTLSDRYN